MHTEQEVDYIQGLVSRFYDMTNANGRGFCKFWKAGGIVWQAYDIAKLLGRVDGLRVAELVSSSLKMEGFSDNDVTAFALWLGLELNTAFDQLVGHAAARQERIVAGSSRK